MRAIRCDNPIAELRPLSSMNLLGFLDLLGFETAVFDAPLSQLLPAMNCHAGIARHHLVEFLGEVRAVVGVKPVSSVHLSRCLMYSKETRCG